MNDESHLRNPLRVRAWKKKLLGKGSEAAKALEAVRSGQEVALHDAIPDGGCTDLEARLRRFLNQIERAIQRVSVDRFGRCAVCASPIAVPILDERPWTERCGAHAS
jgi:RNA polymerase-binding transcription factor DksA